MWVEGSRVKGILDRGKGLCKMLALGESRYPRELGDVQQGWRRV